MVVFQHQYSYQMVGIIMVAILDAKIVNGKGDASFPLILEQTWGVWLFMSAFITQALF